MARDEGDEEEGSLHEAQQVMVRMQVFILKVRGKCRKASNMGVRT